MAYCDECKREKESTIEHRCFECTSQLLALTNIRLSVLEAENKRLREALEKYGHHHIDCMVQHSYGVLLPCNCGYSQALAENHESGHVIKTCCQACRDFIKNPHKLFEQIYGRKPGSRWYKKLMQNDGENLLCFAIASKCCDAVPIVEGHTTQYYVCSKCGKACDVKVRE